MTTPLLSGSSVTLLDIEERVESASAVPKH